ncbi:MAG: hypothetical protein RIR70_781 [Pseudomonadota bacterium]
MNALAFLTRRLMPALLMALSACAHIPQQQETPALRAIQPAPTATPEADRASSPQPQPASPPATRAEYLPPGTSGAAQTHTTGDNNTDLAIAKRVTLNMQDAEARSVVDAVLGDILKRNYTVAPQVQGKITLRTGAPVLPEALLPVLESALQSVSAALIVDEGSYHVVPLESAPSRAVLIRDEPAALGPGYALEVIPLKHVRAGEIKKLLEAAGPRGSVVQVNEPFNHVVIAGGSRERAALSRTIAGFDVDAMRGMHLAIFRLEHISPDQLISDLRALFAPPHELLASRLRLTPLERMQAVIGMARDRADLEMIEGWVKRLDVPPKTGERGLFVYHVQHGQARDLAASLQLVLTGETQSAAPITPPGQKPGASPAGSAPQGLKSASRIVANEDNNSLLIYSTDAEYKLIQDALARLDVMPRQVMIEAILAEVSLNDELRYGVQWFFESGGKTATLSTDKGGAVAPQFPGFSYFYNGNANARAVINALQSQTAVKVLSAPRLAVLNNQKASLQVGDEVPVRTQTSQATGAPGAPVISNIEMRDTGVLLEVTPRVNDNGNIILEVTQEVSDVTTTTTSGIDSPTIARRRLKSVIATRDGATVALGGLIRESSRNGQGGVPVLKDIPGLGELFRDNTRESRRTELVVLLVPRVMRNHAQTDAVVDDLLGALRQAAEVARRAAPLTPSP